MAADRDLLFGLLALQNGLIHQGQLVASFQAWALDRSRALADHLLGMGHLDADDRAAVDALVERHIRKHGGDIERSLAAVAPGKSALESLAAVRDPEIERTISRVGTARGPVDQTEDDRTTSFAVGTATADGLRFRVLRPHARGGLGAIFVALDAELNREVALKQILDQHADDPVSRSRFLIEAEITGGLEHPGIVPIYGLGTYEDGRPYYAMRFIKGDSLKEAVDRFHADATLRNGPGRRSLEVRKLVRRFIVVCDAIGYAHSRGVLHRDIKPGNIIVGKYGETLVVDWGLAKATGKSDPGVDGAERTLIPSSASGSADTLPGSALGTPAYMSPEQAEGDIEHLGPRSDVYSLGATLYYLLTGKPPAEGEIGEVLRAVQRGEFPPPRRYDPTIDPALEAVCLKAMAHRPADRYATPKALSEDIERWMADEPVSAWREPFSRRARRWANHNRTKVTAAAAGLVAGVLGLSAVLAVQHQANERISGSLNRETEANRKLVEANDALSRSKEAVLARYELAVDAIETFHTGVSEDFLLKEEKFKDLRNRLLKSAQDFYGKLSALLGKESDPASRRALAASNFELAQLTAKVGRTADALAAHRAVLAAREALAADPGADVGAKVEVARSLTEVAGLLQATGNTDDAIAAYRQAEASLAEPASKSLEARSALAACRSRMGSLFSDIGRNAEALTVYRLARADQEALTADAVARRDLADTFERIGGLLSKIGKPAEAEVEYHAALAFLQELADENPAVADFRSHLGIARNALGILLMETGRPAEAEAEYRKAMAIRQKLADDYPAVVDFRSRLAGSHHNLGVLLMNLGRPAEAEPEFRQAIAISGKVVEENPALTQHQLYLANHHWSLGTVLSSKGQGVEAVPEFRAALAIYRQLASEDPAATEYRLGVADSHVWLGDLLRRERRAAEAESEYRQAIAIYRKLADDNPAFTIFRSNLAATHHNLGLLLGDTGRQAEAEAEYHEAIAISRKLVDESPAIIQHRLFLANHHQNLGLLLSKTGRSSEAEAEFRRELEIREKLAADNPMDLAFRNEVASRQTDFAAILGRQGRLAEARGGYDRVVAIREALAKENPDIPIYRSHLGWSLRRRGLVRSDLGDLAGAAADARRAIASGGGLKSRSGEEWFETACAHAALAGLAGRPGSGVSAAEGASEAEAAMSFLHRAVASGYRDPAAYRTEDALNPLRDRADFRLLMMDLAFPADPFARRE